MILALLAGGLSVFAFAPVGWFALIFVTLPALFALLRDATPRRAALLAFAFGLGLFGGGVSWVFVSLHTFGGMPAIAAAGATLAFCAYLALYPALAGWLFARLRCGALTLDIALAAACWTLAEWLRGWVFTGFPWLTLGYTQTPPSPIAGFAPVAGVYGASFLVALIAAALGLGAKRLRVVMLAGGILALGAGLSAVRWTVDAPREISVALIQTNIEQGLKWRPDMLGRWLEENRALVASHPAQLMVLPETTLPLLIEYLPEGYLDTLAESARKAGGDLVLGAFVRNGRGEIFNSALSLGKSTAQHYAKSHLVPFGEFSPPLFSWVYAMLEMPMSDQTRGAARQAPLALAGEKIAVNICYEDVFGDEIARAAPGATMMLNLSNLAWYGDSFAQPQHLQIARLRALETGRPMLRATNTGMTAVIAPDGSVRQVLPAFERGVLQTTVRGTTGLTPYARTGDIPLLALCALSVLLGFARRLKVRRGL